MNKLFNTTFFALCGLTFVVSGLFLLNSGLGVIFIPIGLLFIVVSFVNEFFGIFGKDDDKVIATCSTRGIIARYVVPNSGITEEEINNVEKHVRNCESCRAILNDMKIEYEAM